jgi:hypothetical protein
MKMHAELKVTIHSFIISALDGEKWSASRSGHFTPAETFPGTNYTAWEPQNRLSDTDHFEPHTAEW